MERPDLGSLTIDVSKADKLSGEERRQSFLAIDVKLRSYERSAMNDWNTITYDMMAVLRGLQGRVKNRLSMIEAGRKRSLALKEA